MLDELYVKSIEKKEEIRKFFSSMPNEINYEEANEKYHKYIFDKNVQNKNFAAIDGSNNKIKYMAAYLYALSSQTIVSLKNNGIIKESQGSDVDALYNINDKNVDKIISNRMNIFELKSTINTLKKHPELDYMLLDGSLRGSLINFQTPSELNNDILKKISRYNKYFEDKLNEDEIKIEIDSFHIIGKILLEIENEELVENIKEIEPYIVMYIELIEQLTCIYYLLKNYRNKIVCISKTSSSKSIFKENIPDAAVIEYLFNKSGYSDTKEHKSNKIVRVEDNQYKLINYPIRNTLLSNTYFTVFFSKLEDKSNVLKIEVPYKISKDNIIKLLNDLHSISIKGYPYILKKAHDEVKISADYMNRISKNLELINEKTGRDMLN